MKSSSNTLYRLTRTVRTSNCNENALHQVLLNCLLNARDAIEEKGKGRGQISVHCFQCISEDNENLYIEIVDDGVGLAKGEESLVFDPFYTTKDVGKGTGLGLFVSKNIIETAGGEMRFSNNENGGLRLLSTSLL